MKKLILLFVLAGIMAATSLTAQTVIASGDCGANGNNLTWRITANAPDTILTISGSGAMADYNNHDLPSPWFSFKNAISKLVIGDSVTNIGSLAFFQCSGLTGSLIIPSKVTSIDTAAFALCSGLTSLVLPDSLMFIRSEAFAACSGLTGSLIIPSKVDYIEQYTFFSCSGLTSLILPDSLLAIESDAFSECSSLTGHLQFPPKVTWIQSGAFFNCNNLTSLGLPAGLSQISASCFSGCININSITCLASTPPILGSGQFEVFINVPKDIPVCVPVGSEDDYRNAYGWQDFTNISGCAPATYTISGTVTHNGNGLAGVTISYAGGSTTTAANGTYSITVNENTNVTLTPSLSGYSFTPATIECGVVTANLTGKNFAATPTDGILQITADNGQLKVYPNPTTRQLTIDNGGLAIEQVEVYDMYGKLVLRNGERSENIQSIDISGLTNGIYLLKVKTENGAVVRKVVKN